MKTQSKSKNISTEYTNLVNEVRGYQADLLNIVSENLLASWPVAGGGVLLSSDILEVLERYKKDSYHRLNPVCVNLLEMLTKVCELQEKSFELRDLVKPQK